jgi:hypothetical protein
MRRRAHPDGSGEVEMVSCQSWGCRDDSGASFKVWLLQRLPGKNNVLSLDGRPVRNWWEFIGDFDGAPSSRERACCFPALDRPLPCRRESASAPPSPLTRLDLLLP